MFNIFHNNKCWRGWHTTEQYRLKCYGWIPQHDDEQKQPDARVRTVRFYLHKTQQKATVVEIRTVVSSWLWWDLSLGNWMLECSLSWSGWCLHGCINKQNSLNCLSNVCAPYRMDETPQVRFWFKQLTFSECPPLPTPGILSRHFLMHSLGKPFQRIVWQNTRFKPLNAMWSDLAFLENDCHTWE